MRQVVLVTGGSGLVGQCLLEAVLDRECLSPIVDRKYVFLSSRSADLSNYQEARRAFEQHRPNYVVHLAAKVGGLYANMNDLDNEFYNVNNRINENVLGLSYEFGVRRCMSCLSTCIFPDQIDYPLDETKIHLGPPHPSNAGYSLAKRQVDLLNKHYNQLAGGRSLFFAIIPTNIYGPFDNFDERQGHVIPSLINRAHSTCMDYTKQQQQQQQQQQQEEQHPLARGNSSLKLKVFGSGKPARQFIYAPDLARLILWSVDNFVVGSDQLAALILCPDELDELTIGRVAELICCIFSEKFEHQMVEIRPEFDTSKSDGQLKKTASNCKLRLLNPHFSFTPIETGLRKTIDWFCANYPNVRLGPDRGQNSNTALGKSSFQHKHTVQVINQQIVV